MFSDQSQTTNTYSKETSKNINWIWIDTLQQSYGGPTKRGLKRATIALALYSGT